MTVRSRRLPPEANQRPMISSVAPLPASPPYTLAESKKLMPLSSASSMMPWLVASSVWPPKFMVPRHSRETDSPVLPRCVYSMASI